jgi:hypothetical protein
MREASSRLHCTIFQLGLVKSGQKKFAVYRSATTVLFATKLLTEQIKKARQTWTSLELFARFFLKQLPENKFSMFVGAPMGGALSIRISHRIT